MKHTATLALMLSLGAASLYAQQRPVKMTFSGSSIPTSIMVKDKSITDEELLEGNGSFGQFSLRKLRTDAIAPVPNGACSGPTKLYIPVLAAAGVFRFQDGSLLTARMTTGALCVDLAVGLGHLTETYQIAGGTGIFSGASGTLTLTGTLAVVLVSDAGAPALLTSTGEITGTISGVTGDDESHGGPR